MVGWGTDENRKIVKGISLELRAAYGQRKHASYRLVFTSVGVGVGVVMRSVDPYDLMKTAF